MSMKITVLGKSSEKGIMFESMIQSVLDKQGYGNFQTRVIKPGIELDIICSDNVTNQKILVEAKAHEKTLHTGELEKFHSKIITLKEKNEIDLGIFWSISGINPHAKSWYDSLGQGSKNILKIKDGDDFYKRLQELKIIESKNTIEKEIHSLIKKKPQNIEIIFFKNSWYYLLFFETEEDINNFTILDAFGGIVDNFVGKEIRQRYLKLKNMKLILLSSRKQILEILLKKDQLTIDEIIEELKEQRIDIQTTIDDLMHQNLLTITTSKNTEKFLIKPGLETFLQISKEFQQDISVFMKSKYLQSAITYEVLNFVANRFFVEPNDEQIQVIAKMMLISPSALEYCLRTPNVPDQNLYKQFHNKIPDEIKNSSLTSLVSKLCVLTLSDLEQLRHVLGLQDTRAITVDMNLKIATMDALYLSVDAKYTQVTMKAAGSIRKGEAVKIANPSGYIELSILYHNLGLTKQSIKTLNDLLSFYNNDHGDWRKAAYVNLGLFYSELKNWGEAKEWLLKATKLFPEVIEGWLNLGNTYLELGEHSKAKKIFLTSLTKDPENLKLQYGLCRTLIHENKIKHCISKLESLLIKEKRFVNRIAEDKEFKNFKKSKEYNTLLKKLCLKKKY